MKLIDWLLAEKLTMAAFARKVGVSHSAVSRWCRSEMFPKEDRLVLIREATQGAVSAEDFMPPMRPATSEKEAA